MPEGRSFAPKFQEWLRISLKPGGARATAAWLLKRLLPIEIFDFFVIRTDAPHHMASVANGDGESELVVIRSAADCNSLGDQLLSRISRQSGRNVRAIIASGGRVYAFVGSDGVIAQLNITSGAIDVDTPIPLKIALSESDGFLSFLFTYPPYRGKGIAQRLIRATIRDLAASGKRRLVAHVSATNVNSQTAFTASGWRRIGKLITDRRRRIFYRGGLRAQGIDVAPS